MAPYREPSATLPPSCSSESGFFKSADFSVLVMEYPRSILLKWPVNRFSPRRGQLSRGAFENSCLQNPDFACMLKTCVQQEPTRGNKDDM
ncbi:MAG: hypothetical protein CMM07_10315 [Rhodopirellula sp.]|nr:hypothetical protein [Rhodopirellula sp.]